MMDPTTNRDAIGYLGEQARLDGPPNDRELALIEKCEEYLRWVVAENERLRVVADAARNVVAQWRGDISRKPHIGRLRDALAKLDAAGQSGKGGAMSDAYVIRAAHERRVCDIDTGRLAPNPVDEARATLIAAAPEMARLLLERYETHAKGDSGADDSDWYCNFCHHAQQHQPDCRLAAVLRKAGVLR